ncbi:MAG TPA: carboxypeptidase-like regulatory domain-containing protein [Thermoanaerobaculia bacterium]|nr:carboxypeptidase-like regulatory domain-containing protein [Thermoanaerobaculia bacterium]
MAGIRTHRRAVALAFVLLGGAFAGIAAAQVQARPSGVAGRVVSQTSVLASVQVYAYELADLSLHKALTDPQGNFLFQDLPAGLYKIIAHKPGFVPAVLMLTRATAQAYQFLELQLAQPEVRARQNGTAATDDFWALRASIPADVLRDIELGEAPAELASHPGSGGSSTRYGPLQGVTVATKSAALLRDFHTEMQAMTGVGQVADLGGGQVSGGKVGIEGRLGEVSVGLRGRFWQIGGDSFAARRAGGTGRAGDGQTRAVSLDLQTSPTSNISLTSLNNHLVSRNLDGQPQVGLEHYQVSWSQALGENSRSDFAAQYTSENNYYRYGTVDPAEIPGASRTWKVEGAYTTSLGDRSTLQTGVRYREYQFGLASGAGANLPGTPPGLGRSSLDFFGRGGLRIEPPLLVEYGLYSTLRDGSIALTPQGGMVLQLGSGWQVRGSTSRRVYQQTPAVSSEFLPALFKESDLCEEGGKACYEINLSHRASDENVVSLSAVERTLGRTLRLYFSDELFDRLETLYLVPGDRLPELRFMLTRRLSPRVVTKLESTVAAGGGGTFVAADGQPYRNRVRYMVTSLDTRFKSTATGVFVAVHHISQDLSRLGPGSGAPAGILASASLPGAGAGVTAGTPGGSTGASFDRLQLTLTQDLNILMNLAAEWAVQLNMELSRGLVPYLPTQDPQLHRRFLGGLAVRF